MFFILIVISGVSAAITHNYDNSVITTWYIQNLDYVVINLMHPYKFLFVHNALLRLDPSLVFFVPMKPSGLDSD